ncbi:uncharacterized protein LOC133557116 [Nerophis ophidion]|uniref:uncharacterized protein LOC133557116 n=1 Tax=Nerophis ophidion TaxID=159077 RepID=UPI002AE040BA|nr:uncharacterized protein LOC133557116 [Nerophis ophidion]
MDAHQHGPEPETPEAKVQREQLENLGQGVPVVSPFLAAPGKDGTNPEACEEEERTELNDVAQALLAKVTWDKPGGVAGFGEGRSRGCGTRVCSLSWRSISRASKDLVDSCASRLGGALGGGVVGRAGGGWLDGSSWMVSSAGLLHRLMCRVTLCSLGGSATGGAGDRRGKLMGVTCVGGPASRCATRDQSGQMASVLVATETRVKTCAGGSPDGTT